jgi:glycosyltransferase involved in cell wall biosynthesis
MSPLQLLDGDPDSLPPIDQVWPPWARDGEIGLVVNLFDLDPLRAARPDPEFDPIDAPSHRSRLELLRTADQVLAPTVEMAAAAVDAVGLAESRVTVLGHGTSTTVDPVAGSHGGALGYLRRTFPTVRPGFMLCVSEDDPNANLAALVDAYGSLPEQTRAGHQLAIISGISRRRRWQLLGRAGRHGIRRDELLIADCLDDAMLAALFEACDLYVSTYLYDGSGLAIVEAISHGVPVAAGRVGCATEVLGDSRATFEPGDPASIAGCLERLLAHWDELAALRERSRARSRELSWERVAERTLEAYERALPRKARRTGRGRPRIAVLTPWPPQRSGVANHSRHLVGALSRYADIDVIVAVNDGVDRFEPAPNARVAVRHASEFDWLPELRSYDRILYVLGNSEFHVHVLRLLTKRAGHVLMHDVRLTGLYSAASYDGSTGPDWLTDKLVQMYGARIPGRELRRVPDLATENRYGIFMTQEVQRSAEGVLAHSRHALELLRLECPPGMTPPPGSVVSHGVLEPSIATADGSKSEGPVIVSCGIVAPTKGIDTMLNAFARIAEDRPEARLLLVGEANSLAREYVGELTGDLGIEGSVEVRGHVMSEEYWRTLAAADVALQLRVWSNGEASGAAIDCVAARVPTIVTDIGWFSELPEDVVLPIPGDIAPDQVADRITEVLDDVSLRARIRAAQDEYVATNSYAEVARQYAEVLDL